MPYRKLMIMSLQICTSTKENHSRPSPMPLKSPLRTICCVPAKTTTYKEHIEQYGDAVIVPGEKIYTPEGINSIATFIKRILKISE